MARALGKLVTVGGFYLAGGGFTTVFGRMIGGWLLQRVLSKRQIVQGPRVADLTVQAAEYGWDVPKVFGTARITGSIIYSRGLTEHVEDESAGGKGPPEPKLRSYTYTWDGAILWCQGPIVRIEELRYNDSVIYSDDGSIKLGYDMTDDAPHDSLSGVRVSTVDSHWGVEPLESNEITDNSMLYIQLGTQNHIPHSMIEADFGVGNAPAYLDDVVTMFTSFDTGVGGLSGGLQGTFSARVKGTDGALGEVVEWLWQQCGVGVDDASEIDTSELDGMFLEEGCVISRSQANAYLQLLQANYFFDIVHEDGAEKCKLRGREAVVHIPDEDLRAYSLDESGTGGGAGDKGSTERSRGDLVRVPAREELHFMSRRRDFHPNMRESAWESEPESNGESILAESVPFVWSEEKAQRIVDIKHHQRHIENQGMMLQLGTEYRYLSAADVVTVDVNGVPTRFHLDSAQKKEYSVLSWRAMRDVKEVYEAPEGEAGDSVGTPGLTFSNGLYIAAIEAPAGRDADTVYPGLYVAAATPYDQTWRVAAFTYGGADKPHWIRMPDGRDSLNFPLRATMGASVGALGDFQPAGFASGSQLFDNINTLTVDLVAGTLESASEDDVLDGANAALLGSDAGGWEYVQWTTAVYDEENSPANKRRYILSGLLRGQRGTENAIPNHGGGELFLLMDSAVLRANIGTDYLNRGVGVNFYFHGNYTPVATRTVSIAGTSLLPLAPIDLEESSYRDSSNNLTIAGLMRSRLIDNWLATGSDDLRNATHDLSSIRVQVLDAPGGDVLRTLSATPDDEGEWSVEYLASEATLDGLVPGDPVTVLAQQKSDIIGWGFPCEVTL